MITSYLNILQDSLIKKIELLEQIEKKSLEQSEMIKGTNVDLELVDVNMDEKAKLIEEIVKLDNGFVYVLGLVVGWARLKRKNHRKRG